MNKQGQPKRAQAARTITSKGRPGRVQKRRAYGYNQAATPYTGTNIFDLDQFKAWSSEHLVMYAPMRWFHRSRAYSGTQVVRVKYRFWQRNWCTNMPYPFVTCDAGWTYDKGRSSRLVIRPGHKRRLRGWATFVDANLPNGGMYGFDYTATWRTPRGRFLGRMNVDYDSVDDFGCLSQNCYIGHTASGYGWVALLDY